SKKEKGKGKKNSKCKMQKAKGKAEAETPGRSGARGGPIGVSFDSPLAAARGSLRMTACE
ncbi:MAG: hypothetical protein ACRD3A_03860, partial [Terriglobales bacterium]